MLFMNAIPEEQRKRMKEIFAERGKLLQQLKPAGKDLIEIEIPMVYAGLSCLYCFS